MAVPSGQQSRDSLVAGRRPTQNNPLNAVFSSSDSDEPFFDAVDVTREEDEADEVVGVSMGRTQSRMKARQTPAEEKNRIMERNGGYFESIPDVNVEPEGLYLPQITAEPEDTTTRKADGNEPDLHKDASPAQQHPKDSGGRSSFTRSILKNSLPLRPRAWSGDAISNIKFKKFMPDLATLRSSLPFKSNSTHPRDRSESMKTPTPPKVSPELKGPSPERPQHQSDSSSNGADEESISELKSVSSRTAAKHSYSRRPSATVSGAPPLLRRSSSDHSLYLRASSTASSLDQPLQYEHIHTQVNSRFKAIKDTLQDSSSRLLNMPSLHLQDIRNDWGYRQFLNDAAQRRTNNHTDDPNLLHQANGERAIPPRPQPPRSNSANLNPALAEAASELTGDVVVMGGYRGSILRSAKPPQRQLWVPMKVGLNLRKVDLEVGLTAEDEERMEESIIPSGVLSHIGPVDICRRLMRRLQKCDNAVNGDLRVWDYGYDWRLSPHLLARRLVEFLEGLPCNAPGVPKEKRGAYVVAHSLGGLIVRHAVNQRPELFAGVLYAGVPRHCVNILGPLRNGDDVLLSSRVLTAQVNFTFRTSFALLPEDGRCFIDKQTKEEYPLDFFSAKTWDDHHLSPCIKAQLPPFAAGKNLKDNLPLIGRRILGGRDSLIDDLPDLSKSTTLPAENNLRAHAKHRDAARNHPASANPMSDFAHRPPAPIPNIDGVVGPSSTSRPPVKPNTACTIPRDEAMAYLDRTLSEVRQFKQELAFNHSHQSENRYPPFAVLFGKSVPTVYGARVWHPDQIKHQDAYDDLAFAAGDGVCLASAAMMPPGYRIIKDGLVKSERGHVGLLGDLDSVGQCLKAIVRGRREGVGFGPPN